MSSVRNDVEVAPVTPTVRTRLAWPATVFALVPLMWSLIALPAHQWLSFFAQATTLLLFTGCLAAALILSLVTYWDAEVGV